MATGMATDLFPMESIDPQDRKSKYEALSQTVMCSGLVERLRYAYQPNALDAPVPMSISNAVERQRRPVQLELYRIAE